MKKNELNKLIENTCKGYKEDLQTIYDALNQGQRQKLLRNEKIKKIFERFGVNIVESPSTVEHIENQIIE